MIRIANTTDRQTILVPLETTIGGTIDALLERTADGDPLGFYAGEEDEGASDIETLMYLKGYKEGFVALSIYLAANFVDGIYRLRVMDTTGDAVASSELVSSVLVQVGDIEQSVTESNTEITYAEYGN